MFKLNIRSGSISIFLMLFFACFFCPSYPQDNSIRGKTVVSYAGGVLVYGHTKVETRPIYGIKVHPLNYTVKSREKEEYIQHLVENLSNRTNEISIEVISVTPEGWSAELFVDENKDGIHQWWESDRLDKAKQVGEGSMFAFLVKIKRPDGVKLGESGFVTVRASGLVKDGNGYLGGNGTIYGGEDEAQITDTFIVE